MTKKSNAFAEVVLFIESFDEQYGKEVPGLVEALTTSRWWNPSIQRWRRIGISRLKSKPPTDAPSPTIPPSQARRPARTAAAGAAALSAEQA